MILIDDQPYERVCPPETTVRELAREVCTASAAQDRRMVVAVYRDGKAVADEELNGVLAAPVADFGELELQTQPVAALVRSTLEQAIGMLEDASTMRAGVADLLDRGRQGEAMNQLRDLLEVWQQVQQSLLFSAEAMNLHLDTLQVGDCRFTDLLDRMKANLGDLRDAMRNQDPVSIGDLLRYEMSEVFAKWGEFLSGMKAYT